MDIKNLRFRTITPIYLPGDIYVEKGVLVGKDTPFPLPDDYRLHDGLEGTDDASSDAIRQVVDEEWAKTNPLATIDIHDQSGNKTKVPKADDGPASAGQSDPTVLHGLQPKGTGTSAPTEGAASVGEEPQPAGTNFGGGAVLVDPVTPQPGMIAPTVRSDNKPFPDPAVPAKPLPLLTQPKVK